MINLLTYLISHDLAPAPNNGRAEAAHEEHRARPRNQQGNQRNRPRPRSHTPSDINDEEEELAAAPEEGDVPEFPNAQQSPTDPRMAIVSHMAIFVRLLLN